MSEKSLSEQLDEAFLDMVREGFKTKSWSKLSTGGFEAFVLPVPAMEGTLVLKHMGPDGPRSTTIEPLREGSELLPLEVPDHVAQQAWEIVLANYKQEDDPLHVKGRGPVGSGSTHILRVKEATHRITYIEGGSLLHVRLRDDDVDGYLFPSQPTLKDCQMSREASEQSISLYKSTVVPVDDDDSIPTEAFLTVTPHIKWVRVRGAHAEHLYGTERDITLVLSKIVEGDVVVHTLMAITGGPKSASFGVGHPLAEKMWQIASSSCATDMVDFSRRLLAALKSAPLVKTFEGGKTKVEADLKEMGTLVLYYSKEGGEEQCTAEVLHPRAKSMPPFVVPKDISLMFYKLLHGGTGGGGG